MAPASCEATLSKSSRVNGISRELNHRWFCGTLTTTHRWYQGDFIFRRDACLLARVFCIDRNQGAAEQGSGVRKS